MQLRKLGKKGQAGGFGNGAMMAFAGIAIGLLIFGVIMIFFNLFMAQTRTMDIIYLENGGNHSLPTNATIALNSIQATGNTLIDWTQILIMVAVFAVMLLGVAMLGVWGYRKAKG